MGTYENIINDLTKDEKIKLTTGHGRWQFFGIKRFQINELVCGDGPHGLRAYSTNKTTGLFEYDSLAPTTLFPIAAALSSTFNEDLIHQVGAAIGKECNEHNIDLLLAPGINLKRSPLGGRNFEYYSEDPYLTGVMASAFVNGVQSEGVGACIKHFALNEQETSRRFIDTVVDERTMHELYLKPFKYTILHASPKAIMSSYNRVFGDYASESSLLLQDILRKKWKYDGMVISDWGAVQNKVKSIKNGMNIAMPGPSEFEDEINDAFVQNKLSEEELDTSLKPMFDFYDWTMNNSNKGLKADLNEHYKLAQDVAKEAVVLFENDGVLPLHSNLSVALIGGFAKNPRINGGGSAMLKPYKLEEPLKEWKRVYDVTYAKGYIEENTNDKLLNEVKEACQSNDVIVFYTGTTTSLETEGQDRPHMNIPAGHLEVFEVLKTFDKPIITVLNNGSSIDLRAIKKNSSAIIEAWLLGEANGKAVVDIVSGSVNPSGRLSETFPLCLEHTPHAATFPAEGSLVDYTNDLIRVGYRYYDTHNYPIQYPFGYGLSYSTFEYGSATVTTDTIEEFEKTTLFVSVTNTSAFAGYEVVQVYAQAIDSEVPRANKELVGFKKVWIPSKQTLDVAIPIPYENFMVYNNAIHKFVVEPLQYKLLVGKNVRDIQTEVTLTITKKPVLFEQLDVTYPLTAFYKTKKQIIKLLTDEVGEIAWYNQEEPLIRLLKRYKKKHNWTDTEFETWKKRFLE